MADYLDNYDEIVFLDSEIDDSDDDDDTPVGELIRVVDGKVYRAADLNAEEEAAKAAAAPAFEPVEPVAAEETPAEVPYTAQETVAETPAEAPYAEKPTAAETPAEEPAPAHAPYTQTVAPEEEPAQTPAEDLPSPDPVYLYAYGITPSEETAAPAAEAPKAVQSAPAGQTQSTDAPKQVGKATPMPEAETGKSFTATLYHGSGADPSQIYMGVQYPVAGNGRYYAMSQKQARVHCTADGRFSVKATPPSAAPTSSCMATTHHRFVRMRSTNGLQNGLITHGR